MSKVLRITCKHLTKVIKEVMDNCYLRQERLETLELFVRDLKELDRTRIHTKEASIE